VAPPELSIARSVPPDGSSFQQVQFQEKVATSIPPFGYLNLQFFHKVSYQYQLILGKPEYGWRKILGAMSGENVRRKRG
jgi:hypothetical protein